MKARGQPGSVYAQCEAGGREWSDRQGKATVPRACQPWGTGRTWRWLEPACSSSRHSQRHKALCRTIILNGQ